tara:strand:+ start:1744 stop:3027 length:1284 start_codon:yes stop_codon:yes gene_type:complete
MKFSTLFRLEENLNLDKKTLVVLRWIALIGQLIAITLVYFILKLDFPIHATLFAIGLGISTNLFLQFYIKATQLKDFYSGLFLIYDLFQLGILLYLTGGITNPFSLLLIIPAIVSSTFLSMGTTIILGLISILLLVTLTFNHLPLPGIEQFGLSFPNYYLLGILISIIIGLIFLSYFGIRFSGETKKRSEAFNKLQVLLSKEYELESLGGQAAAAAHSLGTPLATISVVVKELKNEIGDDPKYSKDIELLISQTKRCSEILKMISEKKIIDDKFLSSTTFEALMEEIIKSFSESSNKSIELDCEKDLNKAIIQRNPELVYGLRNFVGNAVKFSKKRVLITISSNKENVVVRINDDGDGFPDDVLNLLGEPYIKSKISTNQSGLGLGTFLGKTLLNRKSGRVTFDNYSSLKGARVSIQWNNKDLNFSS